ncbi:MAG: sugar ABC transporter permease [Spirochaetaceae bacterium]|nr:sugar ABC transporter permease [Spirochaetaceae bacterium]MCF7948402.1 sugar ABC transporter permease [Spirochaetia bacterium]MCF7950851.1 sugar ABC transporter permease [Spirochaetaceae bacterium]
MNTRIDSQKAHIKLKESLMIIMLVAPALIIFTTFVVIPVIQAGYYSFFKWKGLGPLNDFRGIENFIRAFNHPVFITALMNNLKIVFLSLFLQLPTAFLLALLIGRKGFFGSMVFRGLYFFPYVLAEIVVGIIWKFIYDPQYGIPTFFARLIKGGDIQIGLLGNLDYAFTAIFIVIFWKYIGFHMILYIAGLQGVPKELEDAAVIDGANKFQVVLYVIIPSMWSAIIISVFLSVIGSFNVFDIVWAMGQGGPVHSTETLVTYLYNFGFKRFAFGYGSAIAIIIFFLCLIFNIFYQKYVVAEK